GHNHHGHTAQGLGGLDHGAAAGITQPPVGDHGVIGVVLELVDGVPCGGRGGHGVAGGLQDGALPSKDVRVLVDTENPGHNRMSFTLGTAKRCYAGYRTSYHRSWLAEAKGASWPILRQASRLSQISLISLRRRAGVT